MRLGWNLRRKIQRDPRVEHPPPHTHTRVHRGKIATDRKPPRGGRLDQTALEGGGGGGLSLHWGDPALTANTVKHSKRWIQGRAWLGCSDSPFFWVGFLFANQEMDVCCPPGAGKRWKAAFLDVLHWGAHWLFPHICFSLGRYFLVVCWGLLTTSPCTSSLLRLTSRFSLQRFFQSFTKTPMLPRTKQQKKDSCVYSFTKGT